MGLIIAALMWSALVAIMILLAFESIGWAFRRILRRPMQHTFWQWLLRHPSWSIVSVAILWSIGCPVAFSWLNACMTWEVTHTDREQAATLPFLDHLPVEASDINFFFAYLGYNADFLVSEKGFREWCAAHEWNPIDIQQANQGFGWQMRHGRRCDRNSFEIEIRNGLVCDKSSHRGGITVAYDRDSGRAYLTVAHH